MRVQDRRFQIIVLATLFSIGVFQTPQDAPADEFPEIEAFAKKHRAFYLAETFGDDKNITVQFNVKKIGLKEFQELVPLLNKAGLPIELGLSAEHDWTSDYLTHVATIKNLSKLDVDSNAIKDDDLKPLENCTKLRRLRIDSKLTTPKAYQYCAKMVNLQEIWINIEGKNTGFRDYFLNDACLRYLTNHPKIKRIDVGGRGFTDLGMSYVKNMTNLEIFRLHNSSISKEGFRQLAGLPKLRLLYIDNCSTIAHDAFDGVADWPHLRAIYLDGRRPLSHEGAKYFSRMKSLESLYIKYDTFDHLDGLENHPALVNLEADDITNAGLRYLKGLPKLEDLDLEYSDLTTVPEGALENLPSLKKLNLNENKIDDAGMTQIGKLSSLVELQMENNKVTEAGLSQIAGLVNLERLNLSGNPIKKINLQDFAKLKKLVYINFAGTKISDEQLLSLKKLMPKTTILDYARDPVLLTKVDLFPGLVTRDISKMPVALSPKLEQLHVENKSERAKLREKFEGKIIQVTGTVYHFGIDKKKGYYVVISAQDNEHGTTCYTGRREPWLNMTPAQRVSLKGTGMGDYDSIELKDTVLVKAEKDPSIVFDSVTLAQTYSADEEGAQKKFKNKRLLVTGKIIDRDFESDGTPVVELQGDGKMSLRFRFYGERLRHTVKSNMKIGKTVTINCEGSDSVYDDPKRAIFYGSIPKK